MCHGGLIVFRCYLRNKTHLVKALQRNPAHTITTSPKTLTGRNLHTWTNTTIWKYEARPDAYQVSVHSLQPRPKILAKKSFRGVRIQGHAPCPTSAKNTYCLFDQSLSLSLSFSYQRRHSFSAALRLASRMERSPGL